MGGELVPFGKHKGKPVEVLLADNGYREWVLAQPWFRDRYPAIYQTIINYGGEPAETPEHNQLQASFLDDHRCLALARLLYPPDLFTGAEAGRIIARAGDGGLYRTFAQHLTPVPQWPAVLGRGFEAGGWDVRFTLRPAALWLELDSLPACICVCDHERDCAGRSPCRGGDGDEWDCHHRDHDGRVVPTIDWWESASARDKTQVRLATHKHCNKDCPWRDHKAAEWLFDDGARLYEPRLRTVCIECKPDLGDDFPAVLRQTQRHDDEHADMRCVVVRRFACESVSWEQVSQMFAASRIVLISEEQLEQAEAAGDTLAGRSTP